MVMNYESLVLEDNAKIAYQTSVPLQSKHDSNDSNDPMTSKTPTACLLLLHGFSGSSEYFVRNTPTLSQSHWILCPDMRGHGQSEQTKGGYHVARLAMDLHGLITLVQNKHPGVKIYAVGCSIGAAVLWTYVELFTDRDFSGLIFVDQAPLQDRSQFDDWNEKLAHSGCYDERTMLEAQRCWASDDERVRKETYKGLVQSCLGYRCAPYTNKKETSLGQAQADEEFFVSISKICNGKWLARLLADHTRYDHREAIELISKPVLVLAGGRSGCFSIDGMMETVRRAKMNDDRKYVEAEGVVYEDSGHWLFWEEPARFNQDLLSFVKRCENVTS